MTEQKEKLLLSKQMETLATVKSLLEDYCSIVGQITNVDEKIVLQRLTNKAQVYFDELVKEFENL